MGPRAALPRARSDRGPSLRHPATAVVVGRARGRPGGVGRRNDGRAGEAGARSRPSRGPRRRRGFRRRAARGRRDRVERAGRRGRGARRRLRAAPDCRSRIRRGGRGARRLARHVRSCRAGGGERAALGVRRQAREPGGGDRPEHRRVLLRGGPRARGRLCRRRARAPSHPALVRFHASAPWLTCAQPAAARRARCQPRSAGAGRRARIADPSLGPLHGDAPRPADVVPRRRKSRREDSWRRSVRPPDRDSAAGARWQSSCGGLERDKTAQIWTRSFCPVRLWQ